MTAHEEQPFRFLGRRLPPAFGSCVVVLAPGDVRPYDRAEWDKALVLVEHGTVELRLVPGGSRVFPAGDVLWLDGLPLRALCNPGAEPAVLVAVSRKPAGQPVVQPNTDEFGDGLPS